jgi:four helix bundle protein
MELNPTKSNTRIDRLESFGFSQLAGPLFDDFWPDSELLEKDFRGWELAKQPVRSLDSIGANLEEGFGRGFGKELPQHLKIARGEARESLGRFKRCHHLLNGEIIGKRVATLDHMIGGWTKTISTIEGRQIKPAIVPSVTSRHSPPPTRQPQ